jgi:ParB family transcriptional regulator, chromosome partitioning protein
MTAKRGLGKGLEALMGPKKAPASEKRSGATPGEHLAPISDIHKNPHQARKTFDETAIAALADSIISAGLLQPLVVTAEKDGTFVLIAGERRLRAAKVAGLTKVPVRIIKATDEKTVAVLGLVENLQRENLDAIDEAEAFAALSEGFGLTQEAIAKAVSKSRPYVANAMRLLELPKPALELVRSGKISAGHGRAILRLPDRGRRIKFAKLIVEKSYSVREAERLADRFMDEEKKKDKRAKPGPYEPLADDLRKQFGTKVEFKGAKTKGRLVIHYFSEEDLTRIIELIQK